MEITYDKLKDKPIPESMFYVLSGDEDRPKREIFERIRKYALGESDGFDEETFEGKGADPQLIISSAQTMPFFSGKRLVVIRNAQELTTESAQKVAEAFGYQTSKGKSKKDKPAPSLPASTCLVAVCFSEGIDDADAQRKAKAVTTILESAATSVGVLISFPEMKGDNAVKQLQHYAEGQSKTLNADTARKLLARVDGDFSLALAELEKIIIFVGEHKIITEQEVNLVATPAKNARIFALVDAIADGNPKEALSQLMQMLGGNERPETVAMRTILPLLARQFRLIWQAKALAEARYPLSKTQNPPDNIQMLLPTEPNILKLLARQPYFEARFKAQAERFTFNQLRKAFRLLLETDMALKGMTPSLSPTDTLERLALNLCSLKSMQKLARPY